MPFSVQSWATIGPLKSEPWDAVQPSPSRKKDIHRKDAETLRNQKKIKTGER
jgi:hypothetical protein